MRTRFIRSSEIEEKQIQAVFESSVNMFACGIAEPPEVLRRAKALGKTTLALIRSPHHVQRTVAADVDMRVAQGYDAGAHTGPIGSYSLVPQIVYAAGVWIGTVWLLSEEHQAHMHPVNTAKL